MPEILPANATPQPIPTNQLPQTNQAVRPDGVATVQQRPDLVVGNAEDTVFLQNNREYPQEFFQTPEQKIIESLNSGDAKLEFRFDARADEIILELVDTRSGQFLATVPIGQATGFTAQLIQEIRNQTGIPIGNADLGQSRPPLNQDAGANTEEQIAIIR